MNEPVRWYVYALWKDNSIVYIGEGTGDRYRASTFTDSNGRAYASMIVTKKEILHSFDTKEDALEYEKALIFLMQPMYNKIHIGELWMFDYRSSDGRNVYSRYRRFENEQLYNGTYKRL